MKVRISGKRLALGGLLTLVVVMGGIFFCELINFVLFRPTTPSAVMKYIEENEHRPEFLFGLRVEKHFYGEKIDDVIKLNPNTVEISVSEARESMLWSEPVEFLSRTCGVKYYYWEGYHPMLLLVRKDVVIFPVRHVAGF